MKFNKKCKFRHFIGQTYELRTVEQHHPYFHPSWMPPHHFRLWTNCQRLLSNPNHELPFCDMLSIDHRPVGTNLVLVRRVGANNLLSMKAERAKRAERLQRRGVQGPAQGPWWGPGGGAPGSPWVLALVKGPERLSWKYFFL